MASAPLPDRLAPYRTAAPESGKSVGHTSVVFKLRLEGGLEAAWKPRSKRGKERYRGEIAAYRLATGLGLSNVPPAIPRAFEAHTLALALGSSTPAGTLLADETTADHEGQIVGALIPWIQHLGFLPLEESSAEWHAWLAPHGVVPPDKRALAADISTMIAFDYLTANWDRWSGGNIGVDPETHRLLFIDNDAAFSDVPPPEQLAGMRRRLGSVGKFSRSFIGAVRGLDLDGLRTLEGEVSPGHPLLTEEVLSGVMKRRAELVAVVDAASAKESDAAVPFD